MCQYVNDTSVIIIRSVHLLNTCMENKDLFSVMTTRIGKSFLANEESVHN